jgi:hypothetical protein
MKKIFTFCVVVAIAGLFTETSSFATPVKPGNCSGTNPGNGYCSCWAMQNTTSGEIVAGSGWCASTSGTLGCDSAGDCPHSSVLPVEDPPGSEPIPIPH